MAGAAVGTHRDLWRWLQQREVQDWLPHEAMLVAWGDIRSSGGLRYDIVSSLPGLRSSDFTPASIAPLIRYLRDCWVAAPLAPCHVHLAHCDELLRDCSFASRAAIGKLRMALVHGTRDARDGSERIFGALSVQPAAPAGSACTLSLMLPYIDTALRRIAPLPARPGGGGPAEADPRAPRSGFLSERELEIMEWVALGKTNPEIGCILHISEFTVKNHLKSIFGKLDVTNRAQAAAKLARLSADA
jgi:Response regulator containing a CheY-like receiver domain and an HTH DNA-binding domain